MEKETPVSYDHKLCLTKANLVLSSDGAAPGSLISVQLQWPDSSSTHAVDVRELSLASTRDWEKAVKLVSATNCYSNSS